MQELNYLSPFFEDCYRRINVREFSRLKKISPPTSSKLLESYHKGGLLKKEKDRIYIYYYANKDSEIFIDLSRIYWRIKLKELLNYLEKELVMPIIILFGSLAKAEAKKDSDMDIAIFTPSKKEIIVNNYEKKLKRKIQIFLFKNIEEVNKELLYNILNGYKLGGNW